MKEKNDLIYQICNDFCTKYAPEEKLILELNKSDLQSLIKKKGNKYEDALASGIGGGEILLPIIVTILTTVGTEILKDGYKLTKERIKEYLDKKKSNNDIKNLAPSKAEATQVVNQIVNIITIKKSRMKTSRARLGTITSYG